MVPAVVRGSADRTIRNVSDPHLHRLRIRWPKVSWPLVRRVALWTAGVVLALVLVATGLVVWSVRRAFPEHGGEVRLAGLSAPVTVYRDDHGIPQIFARTTDDLFCAQGYVHAQDGSGRWTSAGT